MRRRAKVDLNQPEIVKAFRDMGCTVQHLHTIGSGCPDIIVGINGLNILVEIKSPGGTLTVDEILWHDDWRGQVQIVDSVDKAVSVVNYYRNKKLT